MARRAASVILYRRPPELEVFLVERSPELAFCGGYHAFPGGGAEEGDAEIPTGDIATLSVDEREFIGCAIRELEEETGLQITDAALYLPGPRLVTPRFSKIRFDTQFYFLETEEEPEVLPGELVSGAWTSPAEALSRWREGEILLSPPTLAILEGLREADFDQAVSELRTLPHEYEGSGRSLRFTPGVEMLPLCCDPLPPSIPTNTFLLGEADFIIIDPGPEGEAEQAHLLEAITRREARGGRALAIVLSHHHRDHIGALEVTRKRFQLPVWAHPITAELLDLSLDRKLEDGDLIELGERSYRCLFTPGHARGHLAFFDESRGDLFAGDLVSTLFSMYVGSPGGHVATYFESIERLQTLGVRMLFPSHGMPTDAIDTLLERTVQHRKERLEEIRRSLTGESIDVETLAGDIYSGVSEEFRRFYVRATRASLEYLAETGQATKTGEDRYSGV